MKSSKEVKELVAGALSRRFPKLRVIAINIREKENDDGDNVVDISIVFEAGERDFNASKVPELVHELANTLSEAEDTRFPILSFIAKSELGKIKPEAA